MSRGAEQRSVTPDGSANTPPYCPSSQPDLKNGLVIGVVGGTVDEPRVGYLNRLQRVSTEILELSKPAKPTEIFRLAAPCAGTACQHFDGSKCTLAQRMTKIVPEVVDTLPKCSLRPRCRWWQEQGASACLRCPQITTDLYNASAEQRKAADPGH